MAKKSSDKIDITAFRLVPLTLDFLGTTSLLCNRINEEVEAKLDGTAPQVKGRASQTEKTVFDLAYHKNGQWYFPASGIKKALIRAGAITTMAMTDLRTILDIEQAEIPIIGSEPHVRTDTARNRSKALIRVQRAEFDVPWAMRVPLKFVEGVISAEQVMSLAAIAGFGVGLGPWRPENNGPHGKFTIAEVKG